MKEKSYSERLYESVSFLRDRFGSPPEIAVVFGSGLAPETDPGSGAEPTGFSDIPNFPKGRMEGHPRMIRMIKVPVPMILMIGRFHLYEGLSPHEVVFPVRALSEWGVKVFFLTNAAATLNRKFKKGDLMLIKDHIGLFMRSPLPWPEDSRPEDDFTDLSAPYDSVLRSWAGEEAFRLDITLHQGIYLGLPGPAYETPAEIRLLQDWKVDSVGMSTVPEVIALRHLNRKILGLSCLTNYGSGMGPEGVDHKEVVDTAGQSSPKLMKLLFAVAARVGGGS